MERVNVRHLEGLAEPVEIATVDVSFISLRLVLPVVRRLLSPGGSIVALFKPQFEAKKGEVPRGGIVREPLLHATLIGRFVGWCARDGFRIRGLTSSPILGAAGNREFFFRLEPVLSEVEGAASS
jgi:23S rRNA (cytidine1920-2'-O)/16S rRNA (cytidine1409-2'-O)-methyltransferase